VNHTSQRQPARYFLCSKYWIIIDLLWPTEMYTHCPILIYLVWLILICTDWRSYILTLSIKIDPFCVMLVITELYGQQKIRWKSFTVQLGIFFSQIKNYIHTFPALSMLKIKLYNSSCINYSSLWCICFLSSWLAHHVWLDTIFRQKEGPSCPPQGEIPSVRYYFTDGCLMNFKV
jgi:hypothetical protein